MEGSLTTILNDLTRVSEHGRVSGIRISKKLIDSAHADIPAVFLELHTKADGLRENDAIDRLKRYGPNVVASEKRRSILMRLIDNIKNPLVILLTILGVVSYLTGDLRATLVIGRDFLHYLVLFSLLDHSSLPR